MVELSSLFCCSFANVLLVPLSNRSVSSASLPRSLSLFLLRSEPLLCPPPPPPPPHPVRLILRFSSFSLSSLSSQQTFYLVTRLTFSPLEREVSTLAHGRGPHASRKYPRAFCAEILSMTVSSLYPREAAACTSRGVGWDGDLHFFVSSLALLYDFRHFTPPSLSLSLSLSLSFSLLSRVLSSQVSRTLSAARLPLLSHSYAVSADSRDSY